MLVLFALQAIRFVQCNDIWVKDLHVVDSAQTHILILNCQRVNLANLNIAAPGDSPNTDGIHIQNAQHVLIENSAIASGKHPQSPLTIALTMQFIICHLVCMQVMIASQLEIIFTMLI